MDPKCMVCTDNNAKYREQFNDKRIYCGVECQRIHHQLIGIFGDEYETGYRGLQWTALMYLDPKSLANMRATSSRIRRLIEDNSEFLGQYTQTHHQEIINAMNAVFERESADDTRMLQMWLIWALQNGWVVTPNMLRNAIRYNFDNVIRIVGPYSIVTKIYLHYNQLERLPESIGQLSNLQVLYLSDNRLKTLPETIGQLSNLQRLNLHNNRLETLPESIGQLSNLQWLYLDHNLLTIEDVPAHLRQYVRSI